MQKLSPKQQDIINFVTWYHEEHSYMPSVREIQLACKISSTSVVDYNLRILEREGVVRRSPDISRGLELVGAASPERREAEFIEVPVIGTTSEYPGVRGLQVAEGGFISHRDVDRKALSIVLGSLSASTLFPDQDPLGRSVRLSLGGGRITFNFRVIGVMEQEGSGGESETHDNSVFIPVSTLQSRIGRFRSSSGDVNVTQISIQTGTDANKELVKAQITDLLLRRHLVAEPDFVVQSQEDLVSASNEVTLVLSILLGSIAGISLVVGGIGVMNIMLVSVTERTREIGIRRALGARSRDIMTQFVIEALTLCATGGVLGVVVGVGLSMAVSGRQIGEQDVTTVVQTWSIAVAFVVAALVGLLSGSYPAYRAARLDPIEALRTE